jgi:hypothetical protein
VKTCGTIRKVLNFTRGERPGNFLWKCTPKKFATTELVSTNYTPIDLHETAKILQNLFQGSHFREKKRFNNFATVWQFFTDSIYWSIQVNKRNTKDDQKSYYFILGEQPRIFKQKLPRTCTVLPFSPLSQTLRHCLNSITSTEKLRPHHLCLVPRVRKFAIIYGKRFSAQSQL